MTTPNQIRARWREPKWTIPAWAQWSEFPSGSPKWIERVAATLVFGFEPNIYNNTARPLVEKVTYLVASRPEPWKIWPEHRPAGSIDAFFRLVIGCDWDTVLQLIAVFDTEKAEQLRKLAASPEGDHQLRDGDRWTYEKEAVRRTAKARRADDPYWLPDSRCCPQCGENLEGDYHAADGSCIAQDLSEPQPHHQGA
jgi:hypothetical protein